MAILKAGINGPFSGKVGSVVGYELNGQTVIRSLPAIVKKPPSELMLINRKRLKVVSQFLKFIKKPIAFGYKNMAPKGSRVGTFQSAQSYLLHNSIDYDADNNPYVNPEKVMVFRGDMPPPQLIHVTIKDNKLYIEWNKEACKGEHPSAVLVLAYVIEDFFALNEGGALSTAGKLVWEDNLFSRGDQIHIYVGFYDIVHDRLSDSVYGGCV